MRNLDKLYEFLNDVPLTTAQHSELTGLLANIERDYQSLAESRRPDSFEWESDRGSVN
jgi:hypothetical protein